MSPFYLRFAILTALVFSVGCSGESTPASSTDHDAGSSDADVFDVQSSDSGGDDGSAEDASVGDSANTDAAEDGSAQDATQTDSQGDVLRPDADDSDGGSLLPNSCSSQNDCGDEQRCDKQFDAPGSPKVCISQPQRSKVSCQGADAGMGGCCDDTDCAGNGGKQGYCVDVMIGYCGGMPPQPGNSCRYDECSTSADCTGDEVCVPAGVSYNMTVNTCVPSRCTSDADCSSGPDGACLLVLDGASCGRLVRACTYSDGCRSSADCKPGYVCVAGQGTSGATCRQDVPPP